MPYEAKPDSPDAMDIPPSHVAHEGGDIKKAGPVEENIDMDVAAVENRSNGINRVVAVRTTGSTQDEPKVTMDEGNNKIEQSEPPSKGLDSQKKLEKETVGGTANADRDGKLDMQDNEDPPFPPRPLPFRPGWGRNPEEDVFHSVPKSHGGRDQKRAVFRLWPRDPNGKALVPSEQPRGKLSQDGYPWGATLYDIYKVNRCPIGPFSLMTTMTGSALTEVMKEMGEMDAAHHEMVWAMSEDEPRDEGVANTAELIESIERRSQSRAYYTFLMREDIQKMMRPMKMETDEGNTDEIERTSDEEDHDENGDEHVKEEGGHDIDEKERDEDHDKDDMKHAEDDKVEYQELDTSGNGGGKVDPPLKIPITSPFHLDRYPALWPFILLESPLSVLLQERIPLYLLPKRLYVYDPFNLLTASQPFFRDILWSSRSDVIRKYYLRLSDSVRKDLEEARRRAEELEEFKARTLIVLRYKRTEEQIKNHEPVIEVPLPPYPRQLTKVRESHLYISPISKIGDGHHSIVYKCEWELPRDLFVRPKICPSCFKESVDKEIQKLKDSGRWDGMLKAFGWSPGGSMGSEPKQEELDKVSDPISLERDGETIEREITCIVSADESPMRVFQIVHDSDIWDAFMKDRDMNTALLDLTVDNADANEAGAELTEGTFVPGIRLDPPVSFKWRKICTHGPCPFAVPRTVRFTVVAKLSLENDLHLAREATTYQEFPEHFFRHYNGYTIISQLHTIVPVGAIVPQFYGYYEPDSTKDSDQPSYLSPILLLEHCGMPINPTELSPEDQEECASLLLRFQRAGWLHESIAPRNFLIQYGKPTEFPIERERHPVPSFRLIDFGRSRRYENMEQKQEEELWALDMFSKLNGSMNVTLPPPITSE